MRRSAIQCFSSAQLQNIANQTLENNVLASEPPRLQGANVQNL